MSDYRYYEVCPRGFVGELTYIRVPLADVEAVDAHFAGWVDMMFDRGNTSAMCGWTTDSRAHQTEMTWADWLAEEAAYD